MFQKYGVLKMFVADKRELAADIVLKDEKSDLAVLRLRDAGVLDDRFDFLEVV